MRALSDYVRSLGMKFGLHFAFAEAMKTSPVLRGNPDWTSSRTYGYFEAESLCLSHRPVRDWIISEAVRMIDEYGVDWILQDGENMVKTCTKTTHSHDPADSNFSNAVDGLNAAITAIQERRPRVIWENCEDGGNMMTFNMLRRYHTSIAADDSGPLTTRQAIYGITYPFPPRYADRYMPDEELGIYTTRSFMFGGPWIFMNRLEQMRDQDLETAAKEIRLYKSIRRHIRNGKVFHLTSRPAETSWDALQSYDPETGSSIVIVCRADTRTLPRVLLKGLDPVRTYHVRFQQDHRHLVMTGRQLMRAGIAMMAMNSRWSSDIVFVEPLAEPPE
jgi:alpha-galactosidase